MKLKLLVLSAVIGVGVLSTPMIAQAEDDHNAQEEASGSWRFDDEWEEGVIYKAGSTKIAKMVYGYDTDFIDEDYVWTRGYDCSTRAGMVNGKGTSDGLTMPARTWSTTEVTHTSDYGLQYNIWMKKSYKYKEYVGDEDVKP